MVKFANNAGAASPQRRNIMNKLINVVFALLLSGTVHAQGLVKFKNSSTTLISANNFVIPPAAGFPDFYFALLTAPLGTTDYHAFTFAGVYATNTTATTGGRLQGG